MPHQQRPKRRHQYARADAHEQRPAAGGSTRLGSLHRLRRVDGGRVAQLAFGLRLLQGFEDV
jgi:hypothetical protein